MQSEPIQGNAPRADVMIRVGASESKTNMTTMTANVTINDGGDRRRTIVALVSASIISLMVWGLVVVLNVH